MNLRPSLVFALQYPSGSKSDLGHSEIPFETWLEVRGRLVVDRHSMPRTTLLRVGKAIGDHPFLVEAPRTEELAFAGSAGSRRDGNLRLRNPREGNNEDKE